MVTAEQVMRVFPITRSKIEIVSDIVNITGDVDLRNHKKLPVYHRYKIPFQFGVVQGSFLLEDLQLTSMVGSPHTVGGAASYVNNLLTNLIGCPINITDMLYLAGNKFTTLKDIPKTIEKLSLDYSPTLHLLPLVTKNAYFFNAPNPKINNIFVNYYLINNYEGRTNIKKAILKCQKELIDNGFVGNAGW
jgi:hypothetical protein